MQLKAERDKLLKARMASISVGSMKRPAGTAGEAAQKKGKAGAKVSEDIEGKSTEERSEKKKSDAQPGSSQDSQTTVVMDSSRPSSRRAREIVEYTFVRWDEELPPSEFWSDRIMRCSRS